MMRDDDKSFPNQIALQNNGIAVCHTGSRPQQTLHLLSSFPPPPPVSYVHLIHLSAISYKE